MTVSASARETMWQHMEILRSVGEGKPSSTSGCKTVEQTTKENHIPPKVGCLPFFNYDNHIVH